MKTAVQRTSRMHSIKDRLHNFLTAAGDFTLFFLQAMREVFRWPVEWSAIWRQCYMTGNKSFLLVVITGMIMGVVLTIQSRPVLEDFGAESWLPAMVSVSLVREIAPVITALICAGKIGSGIGAELGSMRVTEQIDAMEVSAGNPMKYLVSTRIIACTLMIPLLSYFAMAAGLAGSFLGVNIKGDVTATLFLTQAMSALDFTDIIPSTLKSLVFGLLIGLVGSYYGYNAGRGTESVGKAANTAVVMSSLLVFIVDVVAVQLTDLYLAVHE